MNPPTKDKTSVEPIYVDLDDPTQQEFIQQRLAAKTWLFEHNKLSEKMQLEEEWLKMKQRK